MPQAGTVVDSILGHVTKTGVIGGGIYVAAQLALAVIHHSWEDAFQAVGYVGLLFIAAGAAFTSKKVGQAIVNIEADKIEADPTRPNLSSAPAVQRELDRRAEPKP